MATLAPVREQAAAGYTYSPIIDVADLKDRQHLSGTGPDDELTALERSAVQGLSVQLNRIIADQERIHYFDAVPSDDDCLILERGPVRSIIAVEVLENASWTAIDAANYIVEGEHDGSYRPPGVVFEDLPLIRPVNNDWGEIDFDTSARWPFRVRTNSGWEAANMPEPFIDFIYRSVRDRYVDKGLKTDIQLYSNDSALVKALNEYSAKPLAIVG